MGPVISFLEKFNSLGLDVLYNYIINYLGTLLPFTKLPIIKQILGAYIKKRLVELKEGLEGVEFHFINSILVSEQVKLYIKEVEENLKIQETGTDEEKKKAREELIAAARNLIRVRNG